MFRLTGVLVALILTAAVLPAYASTFVCWLEDGRRIFTSRNQGESCERIQMQTINPSNMYQAAAEAPIRPTLSNAGRAGQGTASAPAKVSMVSPAGFPRIDASTQRARDFDRAQILEQELRFEQARLQERRTQYNNGRPQRLPDDVDAARYERRVVQLRESIERSEDSIAALKREMAMVK